MKLLRGISALLALVGLAAAARADFSYSQIFDSMGSGTAAPSGWSVLTIAGASSTLTLPTSVTMTSATAGSSTLAVWNQTSAAVTWGNQAANMGSTASDTNRLLGTSPTGTLGSMLQLDLANNSGETLSAVNVAYDMKAMKNGTLKSGFSATAEELPGYRFYFIDGATWTHVPSLDLANDTLNSVGHASATINFTSPVADGSSMKFRWFDDNGDPFSPDFMIAIDNVSVASVPEPASLAVVAIGVVALMVRRRRV